jgi:hypothetical protein
MRIAKASAQPVDLLIARLLGGRAPGAGSTPADHWQPFSWPLAFPLRRLGNPERGPRCPAHANGGKPGLA